MRRTEKIEAFLGVFDYTVRSVCDVTQLVVEAARAAVSAIEQRTDDLDLLLLIFNEVQLAELFEKVRAIGDGMVDGIERSPAVDDLAPWNRSTASC